MKSAVSIAPAAKRHKFLMRLCASNDTVRQIDLALSIIDPLPWKRGGLGRSGFDDMDLHSKERGDWMIRHATIKDASRIAEILIFTKRMNYRRVFQNDLVSFGEMQVYPLAKDYVDHPDKLKNIWVYDDGIVKGMLRIDDTQITELYVDSFFENQGIGTKLMEFAVGQMNGNCLWVLEKNTRAIHFYKKHGFSCTGERRLQEGTTEILLKMRRE